MPVVKPDLRISDPEHIFATRTANKSENLQRLIYGEFGNCVHHWLTIEETIRHKNGRGRVSVRNLVPHSPFMAYSQPVPNLRSIVQSFVDNGANLKHIYFNDDTPDDKVLLQGEIAFPGDWRSGRQDMVGKVAVGPGRMREVLEKANTIAGYRLTAVLKEVMWPSSWADFESLAERYPGHVVEFGVYSCALGKIPGRNTVIWEVRYY